MAIHDIHMDAVGAGPFGLGNLFAEAGKISCED